jgi:hypothetical protein
MESLVLVLPHLKNYTYKNMEHIIEDLIIIPNNFRKTYLTKCILNHINSTKLSLKDFFFTHGSPVKIINYSNEIKKFVKEDAEKAFEESLDKSINYIMITSHYSYWPLLKKFTSKLNQKIKLSLTRFAKLIFINIEMNTKELIF